MSEARVSKGRVVLAGGSGFLGRALAEAFAHAGYEPVVLTRRVRKRGARVRQVAWDGRTLGAWTRELEGAAAVVNLAGRSVECRHTSKHRREIVESRVDSVETLGRAIAACDEPPQVLVQAASLAIYGDAGRRICVEDAPAGQGFPVEVCLRWEQVFNSLELPATRKVLLRIGFVLGRDGGALPKLARLARLCLGGTVGEGHQYVSWLHLRDFCRLVLWCVEREQAAGVYNATGPCPVTNAEFMCELRCALRRPWSPRMPAWLVRLGAFILRTEPALALEGRRCLPERFVEEHFKFLYTNLESALADLLTESKEQEVKIEGERQELEVERRPVINAARTASVGRG
ncbi:MAG: TIGR01777 family oxidoreductase [Pyrinomonadaceae bacterium]